MCSSHRVAKHSQHEAHCNLCHIPGQPKLDLCAEHLLDYNVDDSTATVRQCAACSLANMRRKRTKRAAAPPTMAPAPSPLSVAASVAHVSTASSRSGPSKTAARDVSSPSTAKSASAPREAKSTLRFPPPSVGDKTPRPTTAQFFSQFGATEACGAGADLYQRFTTAAEQLPTLVAAPVHTTRAEVAAGQPTLVLDAPSDNVMQPVRTTQRVGHAMPMRTRPAALAKHKGARPFEFIYIDNKAYPNAVAGGRMMSLVFVDIATWAVCKRDVTSKAANGQAFRAMAAQWGLTKVPWPVTVFTDGCGSMVHVAKVCEQLGLNHQATPPYDPSLNPCELATQIIWGSARAALLHGAVDPYYYPFVVEAVCQAWFILPTTRARAYVSPHKAIFGKPGSYKGVYAPGTHAHVSKTIKNKPVPGFDDDTLRAEPCIMLCRRSVVDNTYVVLVKRDNRYHTIASRHVTPLQANSLGGPRAKIDVPIHSRHVGDYNFPQQRLPRSTGHAATSDIHAQLPHAAYHGPARPPAATQTAAPSVQSLSPTTVESFESGASDDESCDAASCDAVQDHTTGTGRHTARVHPDEPDTLVIEQQVGGVSSTDATIVTAFLGLESEGKATHEQRVCLCAALTRTVMRKQHKRRAPVPSDPAKWKGPLKDIPWRMALQSSRKGDVIAALQTELDHLLGCILTPIGADHPERAAAERSAQPGRFLLDVKRSGKTKVRGVQQGHREDRSIDGPDFNYFSRVADLASIRMLFFRPDRRARDVITIDISFAFLQSVRFPPTDPPRYLRFMNPVSRGRLLFKQLGPTCGAGSSPARWYDDTLCPFLLSIGFEQDPNEPCAFTHPTQDIVLCVFVDDLMMCVPSAQHPSAVWFLTAIRERFRCNDPEFLTPGCPVDFIGMDMGRDEHGVYLSMGNYVRKLLETLGMQDCKHQTVPLTGPVTDFTPLSRQQTQLFMTIVGSLGWLAATTRIDVRHAHSRLSQHLAKPTVGALELGVGTLGYLRLNPDLCLAQLFRDAVNPDVPFTFYTDSDHASNGEVQNKRRSQYGAVALLGRTPVYFMSKVWSTATAHPALQSGHVSTSSAESEMCGMANACKDFLSLSYKAAALNIECPLPLTILCDNNAAIVFQKNTAARSTLKHIDCRQEWCKLMRDASLVRAEHVPSADNLSDLLTKVQRVAAVFLRLRDQLLVRWELPQ